MLVCGQLDLHRYGKRSHWFETNVSNKGTYIARRGHRVFCIGYRLVILVIICSVRGIDLRLLPSRSFLAEASEKCGMKSIAVLTMMGLQNKSIILSARTHNGIAGPWPIFEARPFLSSASAFCLGIDNDGNTSIACVKLEGAALNLNENIRIRNAT